MASSRTPRAPRVELHITEDIIDKAVPRDSGHCIWADAVKAAYPDAQRIAVDVQTIRFSDPKKGLRFTYLTPRVAQVSLINWDQGIKPNVFSCLLRAGHVTRMTLKNERKTLTPAQVEQRKKAGKLGNISAAKARLVSRGSKTAGNVPDRVGGKTPPLTSFSRRREFGLRAFQK